MPTFEERAAYLYAIEEVYWRHRIWPKDNPQPKPPLDAIVSQREIEKEVEDYLRKSQLVADKRVSPISAGELQAEMERMAQHTKRPEMLRELFEALGNNPLVIAECLARPILAERLVAQFSDTSRQSSRAKSRDPVEWPLRPAGFLDSARNDTLENATYKLPEILVAADCTDDMWTATITVNAPEARETRTAVWTGSELIIWGGSTFSGSLNSGGRYNPVLDTWTATSTTNAPEARGSQSTVWTGSELIIWGGFDGTAELITGGRYNPITDSWTPTSTSSAPAARADHTAVWTGSEMVIWGGFGCGGNCNLNSGGRYNSSTDSWVATSTVNAPAARWEHSAVWTGSEMIVWGGSDDMNALHTGGRYSPATDSWMPTGLISVPLGRVHNTAVWTGREMIVWGGVDETFSDCNTGGRYNPAVDSWTATTTNNAPSPRDSHTAVWTGTEMIVWGGAFCCPGISFDTGGRYNPRTDNWKPTSTANVPLARQYQSAVWTGDKMIIWGGLSYPSPYLNTGGTYCAEPSTQLQSVVSQKTHGFSGDFDLNLPLSGTPAVESRTGGATNDYTIVLTFDANVTVTGNPQAAVSSGIGTVGSGGVSNGGRAIINGNIVTIPLTNVANAQTIQVTLYGLYGSTNLVIPISILIGDTNGNGSVNASDVSQTKSRVGQQINATNFRADVNADGYIDAADVALIKAALGTGLP
jgi:N-acetylneuraminic acid mutarotase